MKQRILLILLVFVLFSCRKYGNVKSIVITDINSEEFRINAPDSILNLRRLMDKRSNTKRVPLGNKGRIDIYLFDSIGQYEMWSFCNTPQYGALLVKENSYGTIYKNPGLDSFFKEFKKHHPTFDYW